MKRIKHLARQRLYQFVWWLFSINAIPSSTALRWSERIWGR